MPAITTLAESSKSGGLEGVKYYVFDGEDVNKWDEYSIIMLAFAETKGWVEGLIHSSATDKKKKKSCMTMSLTRIAFKFLNRSKNFKDVWEALEEEYAST